MSKVLAWVPCTACARTFESYKKFLDAEDTFLANSSLPSVSKHRAGIVFKVRTKSRSRCENLPASLPRLPGGQGVLMDVVAYNAAINCCEGHWEHAVAFLQEMQDCPIQTSIGSFIIIIKRVSLSFILLSLFLWLLLLLLLLSEAVRMVLLLMALITTRTASSSSSGSGSGRSRSRRRSSSNCAKASPSHRLSLPFSMT